MNQITQNNVNLEIAVQTKKDLICSLLNIRSSFERAFESQLLLLNNEIDLEIALLKRMEARLN